MKTIFKAMLSGVSIVALVPAPVLADQHSDILQLHNDIVNSNNTPIVPQTASQSTVEWLGDFYLLQNSAKVSASNPLSILATGGTFAGPISVTTTSGTAPAVQGPFVSPNMASARIVIAGLTAAGQTAQILATVNGAAYVPIAVRSSAFPESTTISADGSYIFNLSNAQGWEIVVSAGTSNGTLTYSYGQSPAPTAVSAAVTNQQSNPLFVAPLVTYNATPLTLTTGQSAPAQADASGRAYADISPYLNGNGQAKMAASSPVVIASDQAAIPVTGTFFQPTQPISATALPLPSGAATAAGQSAQQGSVAPGTAASASVLGGGIYNSTLPTLANGQQASLQFDSSGRLIVSGSFTASSSPTAGSSTGGTAATSSDQIGGVYNSTLPTLTSGQQAAAQLDSSGRLFANISPSLNTNGAKTSANSSPVVIASDQSTIPVSTTNGATSANQPTNAASASATSGQTGTLGYAAASTAAPSLTTAQSYPLSLTLAGALRVDNSAVTQPVSGTVAIGAGSAAIGTVGVTSLPALVAGSAIVGKFGIDQTTPGTTNKVSLGSDNVAVTPSNAATAATSALQSSVQGSAAGGTAATSSSLDGGVYNATLPTLSTGQQAAVQLDANGRVQANIAASLNTNGQKTMANSSPIVVASDQTPIPTATRIAFTDSTTALAASGTVSGTFHDTGIAQGSVGPFAYYNVLVYADQAGTVFVEGSLDGTTAIPETGVNGQTVAAGASVIVKVPLTSRYQRVRFTNGGTAQGTFFLTSAFTKT